MRALTYIPPRSVSATRTNATTLVAHPRPAVRASSSEVSGRVSEGKKQEAPVAQVPGRRGRGRAVQASRGEGPSVPSVPTRAAGWDCHCFCPPPPHPPALTGFLDSFELGGSVVRSTVSHTPLGSRSGSAVLLVSFSLSVWNCREQTLYFCSVDSGDFLAFTTFSAFLLGLCLNPEA